MLWPEYWQEASMFAVLYAHQIHRFGQEVTSTLAIYMYAFNTASVLSSYWQRRLSFLSMEHECLRALLCNCSLMNLDKVYRLHNLYYT